MTRRLTLWLTVVTLALGLALPAAAAEETSSSTKVYLALGDSLAVGHRASTREQGYVRRLYRFFNQPEHGNVDQLHDDLATLGETSGSMISEGQLAQAVATIEDPATNVRVVTLDIGGNDVLDLVRPNGACRTNPDSVACRAALVAALAGFAETYPQILGALTEALAADPGNERLLVMTYYNPFSGASGPLAAYEPMATAALVGSDETIDCAANAADPTKVGLNDLIACIGAEYGATIVDVYTPFLDNGPALTHVATGDIHPNDAGYEKIAKAFIDAYKLHGFAP